MSKLKIKVCGMRDIDNIREIAELSPDLTGFIFYPASPRYIGDTVPTGFNDSLPLSTIRTGVFVDEDLHTIKAIILRFALNAVQLHGNESPATCKQLLETGVIVIKAFRISANTDFSAMLDYVPYCKWFLFDTDTKVPGGSGQVFDWGLLGKYEIGHPFFLSGGIGPADEDKILSLKHPALTGIDINSRFETEPGRKDVEKVRRFMQALR